MCYKYWTRNAESTSVVEMAKKVLNTLGGGRLFSGRRFSRDGLEIYSYQESLDWYLEIWWKKLLVYKHCYLFQSGVPPLISIYRSNPVWVALLKKFAEEAEPIIHQREEKRKAEELDRFTFPRDMAPKEDEQK